MQINTKLLKNKFEKSFKLYNKNAVVQSIMADRLVNEILNIKNYYENILELGCGSGLLTDKMAQNINFKNYFANDLSEKSKFYVNKIIPNSVFYCGNAQKIKPSRKMDLIISNAVFQWFTNLEKVTSNYKDILNPEGILAFSTFAPGNFKEIKDLTGLSLDYKSLTEIKQILNKNFKILHCEEFTQILEFSTPLELLAHIKNTGVNSLDKTVWTFKDVKDFCNKYKQEYHKITLTYSPVIVTAQKK